MKPEQFDGLTRIMVSGMSRRQALRGLAGAVVAGLGARWLQWQTPKTAGASAACNSQKQIDCYEAADRRLAVKLVVCSPICVNPTAEFTLAFCLACLADAHSDYSGWIEECPIKAGCTANSSCVNNICCPSCCSSCDNNGQCVRDECGKCATCNLSTAQCDIGGCGACEYCDELKGCSPYDCGKCFDCIQDACVAKCPGTGCNEFTGECRECTKCEYLWEGRCRQREQGDLCCDPNTGDFHPCNCDPPNYTCPGLLSDGCCQPNEKCIVGGGCYPLCQKCEVYSREGGQDVCRSNCGSCQICEQDQCRNCNACETCPTGTCVPITCPPGAICNNGTCLCGGTTTLSGAPLAALSLSAVPPCGNQCCDTGQCCQNGACVSTCGPCQTCDNGTCRGCDSTKCETCINGTCTTEGKTPCYTATCCPPETPVCCADYLGRGYCYAAGNVCCGNRGGSCSVDKVCCPDGQGNGWCGGSAGDVCCSWDAFSVICPAGSTCCRDRLGVPVQCCPAGTSCHSGTCA
jgi:hypothetical protein